MRYLVAILLGVLSLAADPLPVREPQVFTDAVSVQVDSVPIGTTVTLETLDGDTWRTVCTVTNVGCPSLVVSMPAITNRTFRAFTQ